MTKIEAMDISPPNGFNVVIEGTNLTNLKWYKDIIFYLKFGQFLVEMYSKERITLKMNINHYVLVSGVLFRRNCDCVLLICLYHSNSREVLQEFHSGVCGGHFSPVLTAQKIIWVHYYWPTMFKYSYDFFRKRIPCQTFSGKMKTISMPLEYAMVERPFSQWGLDVIGPIKLNSIKGHAYIIATADYFTKWQEVEALRNAYLEKLIHFLKENVLSRFGVPENFIKDNGSFFIGSKFTKLCAEYGSIMGHSSNYYS
jgi:hypothetical protein